MSFQTLSCQAHLIGNINNYRSQYVIKSNSIRAVKPFSVLFQINGSGSYPISKNSSASGTAATNNKISSLLNEVNTVGIIGGLSAISTVNFLEKLVRWSSKGEEALPFLVCNDPVLKKELLFPERSSPPTVNIKRNPTQLNPTPVLKNLRRKKAFLKRSGARCIVMPCHILHTWHDEISKGCSLPFLHIGECVAKELKEANLKPLEAGSNLRIGVLGTDVTLQAGFYQEKLQSQGFEVVLLDKATMEHTIIPATEALNRKDMEGARNLFRVALQVLLVRGVNTVVLASDDMVGLLPDDDPLLKRCVDPMDALARSTIKWSQATTQKSQKNT